MGSRKKPGDKGFRKEAVNPAAVANEKAKPKGNSGGTPSGPGFVGPPKPSADQQPIKPQQTFIQEELPESQRPIQEGLVSFPSIEQETVSKIKADFAEGRAKVGLDKAGLKKDVETIKAGIEPYLMAGGIGTATSVLRATATKAIAKIFPNVAGTVAGRISETILTGSPTGFLMTVKTGKSIKKVATKIAARRGLGTVGALAIMAIIYQSFAGKAFGQSFIGNEETSQGVGIVVQKAAAQAYWDGDRTVYDRAVSEMRQVHADPTIQEEIISYGGPLAIIQGEAKYSKQALSNLDMMDLIMDNRMKQLEQNLTDQEAENSRQVQENRMYRDNILLSDETKKKYAIWEAQLRRETQDARDEKERKIMEDEAAFWAKEKEKERKREAQDRRAIAAFWAAYRKAQRQMNEDSRPSNLNFGLL